jgi:cysteine desulfurase/selenocysteine lyase
MDLERIRGDFGILREETIVYFDNAATSLTPDPVLSSMNEFYERINANPGRGAGRRAVRAEIAYEEARRKVADFIGAGKDGTVVFTRNATEAVNLAAAGLRWERGDRIVTTSMEHHSNLLPWLRLAKERGVALEVIDPDPSGQFDIGRFEAALEQKTRLLAFTHASNVLGSITPAQQLISLAKRHGALTLVDGAQYAPHRTLDVTGLGCDFYAFSAHKMLGPMGMGALYCGPSVRDTISPLLLGGGQVKDADIDFYELLDPPKRFEAGTQNVPGAIGFARALDYLRGAGIDAIQRHDAMLVKRLVEGLGGIRGVERYGPEPGRERCGIVSFSILDENPHRISSLYEEWGNVVTRSGHMCAYPLMKRVIKRPDGVVRASVYLYNTAEEVDGFLEVTEKIVRFLKR